MLSSNDKVSIRQVQILLILDLFGTTALTLPRVAAEYAGPNAWLIIIFSTLLALGYAYLIGTLTQMFPKDTFVEYSQKILGRFLGIFLSLGILIYMVLLLSLEVRVFAEVNKQYLLDATPTEFIIVTMLFTVSYLVRKGYECRARLAEVVFPFVFIPLFLVLFVIAFQGDYSNLKPILYETDMKNVLRGSYFTSLTFTALSLILLFVPYYRKPQRVRRGMLQVVLVVGAFQLITVVLCIARFGVEGTKELIWPVLATMRSIQFPQAFIENQEGLIMLFWILAIFSTLHGFLYGASFILCRLFKTKEHNLFVLPLVPIIYVLALQPDSVPQLYTWMRYIIRDVGVWFLIPIPAVLWIIAKLRRLGGVSHEEIHE